MFLRANYRPILNPSSCQQKKRGCSYRERQGPRFVRVLEGGEGLTGGPHFAGKKEHKRYQREKGTAQKRYRREKYTAEKGTAKRKVQTSKTGTSEKIQGKGHGEEKGCSCWGEENKTIVLMTFVLPYITLRLL